jgi:predicted RND superfamily exporter protein
MVMLSTTRKILAALVAIGLVIVGIIALFVLPAELIVFKAAPYQQALKSQDIYAQIPPLLASLATNDRQNNPGSGDIATNALARLNEQEYQQVFTIVTPPDYIEAQTNGLVSQLMDYLNFKSDKLSLIIDLNPIKAHLTGNDGIAISQIIVNSFPDCTADQLAILGLLVAQGSDMSQAPLCKPPQEFISAAYQLAQSALQDFASKMPDQLNLADSINSVENNNPSNGSSPQYLYATYQVFRWLFRSTLLIALVLVLILAVITFRSLRTGLAWIGVPAILIGLGGLVIVGLLFLSGSLVASSITDGIVSGVPEGFVTALTGAIQQVMNQFYLWSGVISVVVMVAGAGLAIVSRLIPPKA